MMAQREKSGLAFLHYDVEQLSDGGHGGQLQRRDAQDQITRAFDAAPQVISFAFVCGYLSYRWPTPRPVTPSLTTTQRSLAVTC